MTNSPKTFRASPKLEQVILDAADLHGTTHPKFGRRSPYIRLALTEDARLWTSSPYIALSAKHVLLVGPDGQFLYYRLEDLKLNESIRWIPASIEMKHAKLRAFLAQASHQPESVADYLQRHWKCAKFSLYAKDSLLDRKDGDGITSKNAMLACGRPARHTVQREICTVLADYAQWFDKDNSEEITDSVEIDVDVPTLDLDMFVIIDARLYRDTDPSRKPAFERKAMHFELQTAEGQRLLSEPPDDLFTRVSNVTPPVGKTRADYNAALSAVRSSWALAQEGFSRVNYPAPPFPEEAFFYRIQIKRQNPGLRNAVTWPRPDRPKQPISSC